VSSGTDEDDLHQRMQRIEGLLQQIESFPNATVRETAREVVQTLMDLHGSAIAAMLDVARESGAPGQTIIDQFGRDGLIASVLLLYGLHPVDLATRARRAVDQVRPLLRSQGGDVALVDVVEGGALTVRVSGPGDTASRLRATVEQAIYSAVPDVVGIEIEECQVEPEPSRTFALPLVGGGHHP
jgi:Fe-S cluster biogenesis protein NfuA